MSPQQALLKYFGFNGFRKNQLEIIEAILNGQNVIAVLPTGAGKSICYQIPALISENFSIVVSPLIALMKDQVDSLNSNSDLSAFINSTMEFYETEKVLQNIAFGKTKILYVAPERLENVSFAKRIKSLTPSYLFIDEAHCISEWGHNFRPSYRKIKAFAEFADINKIAAFTATATPEVVEDIGEQLGLKSPRIFVKGFERENLHINLLVTKKKKEKCYELIRQFKTPAIIYTSSRKKAEEVTEFLNMNRINCNYYHAGMAPEERKKIQEDFINDNVPVIAATNAFGMGIDKKDIRLVIHYNTPGSIENYYQEIGRAGRDNKPSFAFLLHDDNDINIHRFFISNANPDKELIQNIYNGICDYAKVAVGDKPEDDIPINREYLSAYCKKEINRGLLHSCLKNLESAGYLNIISEYNRKSTIQINFEKNRLKKFIKETSNNNIKVVLVSLLREFGGEIFALKVGFNLTQLSQKLDINEADLEETLVTLDNLGIISYKRSLGKENVKLTVPRVEVSRLILDYKRINENYLHLQKKIESMVNMVYSNDCRFKYILKYFGEDVANYKCGKCDRCTGEVAITDLTSDYLKEIVLRAMDEIGTNINEQTLINILLGNEKSAKFQKLKSFGSCANYSKSDIKIILNSLKETGTMIKKTGETSGFTISKELQQRLEESRKRKDIEQGNEDYEKNLEIFNSLREIRTRASKRFLQSGNIICPDTVMREIAIQKPSTDKGLLKIKGFSQRMFNKVGKEFLEVLASQANGQKSYQQTEKIPANIKETYSLLKKGYNLKDIASLRKLSEAVISMQIESIIEFEPAIKIAHLFEKDQLEKISAEIRKGYGDLKELKKRLPEEITYPLIRIAVAREKFRNSFVSSTVQDKQ
jgi:ATP-dependent DNA helicase RecQ